MMSAASTLKSCVDDLIAGVSAELDQSPGNPVAATRAFQTGFEQFAYRASDAGLELDESLNGAISGLEAIFSQVDGFESSDETRLTSKALASFCTAYVGNDDKSSARHEDRNALSTESMQLWALHDISRQATVGGDVPELLSRSVRLIADTTGSDACAVFLYDDTTDVLVLGGATGLNPASVGVMTIRPSDGITGLAAQDRRTQVAPDAQEHPAWVNSRHFGDTLYTSQVSIPMLLKGPERLIGVLNVLSTDRRVVPNEELDFLETAANELAMSVDYSRLRNLTDERLSRKIEELGTLQRVSRSVASTLDVDAVLKMIVESAAELTGAEAAAIYRLDRTVGDPSRSTPVQEYRTGHLRKVTNEILRDEIVRQAIDRGEGRVAEVEFLDGSSRIYCIPLSSAREAWGAICVRLAHGDNLSTEDVSLLQAFTDVASIAIEHAKLFEQTQQAAQTSTTLLQEMNHRVRNNLQTLAALLSLQLRQATSEETIRHLTEASGRIQAIAAVHDLLTDKTHPDATTLDSIAKLVAEQVSTSTRPPTLDLAFEFDAEEVPIPSREANLLAIVFNELMSNAILHGFAESERGTIRVRARISESETDVELAVENDGIAVGSRFDVAEQSGLGLKIVQRLVESDLNGSLNIHRGPASGTRVEITFPIPVPMTYSGLPGSSSSAA